MQIRINFFIMNVYIIRFSFSFPLFILFQLFDKKLKTLENCEILCRVLKRSCGGKKRTSEIFFSGSLRHFTGKNVSISVIKLFLARQRKCVYRYWEYMI